MMREEMVVNGLNFLRHANVQSTPLSERVSFLEQKGMTKEEIEAAIERYEKDPTESVPAVNHNTVAASAMPMVLAAQQMMQYPKRKLPTYVRMFVMVSSIVGAATLLGFIWDYILRSGFFPWMRSSKWLLKEQEETELKEKEKEKELIASLSSISTAIDAQTAQLSVLCTTLDQVERNERLGTNQSHSNINLSNAIAEQTTLQSIAQLKAEVSTLKTLLLPNQTSSTTLFTANPSGTIVTPNLSPSCPRASFATASKRLTTALQKCRSENSLNQLRVAAGILIMYVKNVVENPEIPRYRRIASANTNFKTKVEPLLHHEELLQSIGFEGNTTKEWKWYTLDRTNGEFDDHVAILRAFLHAFQSVQDDSGNEIPLLEQIAQQSLDKYQRMKEHDTSPNAGNATNPTSPTTSAAATTMFMERLQQQTHGKHLEASPNTVESDPLSDLLVAAKEVQTSDCERSHNKDATPKAVEEGPSYPTSFRKVMEMVEKGESVPGIQVIEDKISEDASVFLSAANDEEEKPLLPIKPWEKSTAVQ